MTAPHKRPAFEPAERLFAHTEYDPHMKRPITTVAGSLLVFLRVAIGVLWIIEAGVHWDTYIAAAARELDEGTISPDVALIAYVVVATGTGIVLLIYATLGVLIYRGRNAPRILVMTFTVFSIVGAFTAWWVQGQEITLRTSLLSLALDILLLLALSSRSAAAYARRNQRV